MRRILLVDDEINVLHALQRTLRQSVADDKFQIEIYTDPQQALARSREVAFDIVISDYRMPEMNGVDFLKALKEIQPDTVRLVLSASTEFDTLMDAINQAEVFRYIIKPWQDVELKEIIQLALARRDQALEDLRLFDKLRVQFGEMTPQELEAKRLEADEPGITKVNWGPDGSVPLD
ncbi:MAG TPA: response regulator [Oxalobacteraceae bacterium]|nr:response regulator [Oxalobacteraceae bacterium]